MTERQQATLVAHGALVFLFGMAAGFPFAFEILQRVETWPIPGSIAVDIPGDVRGWRMAHLEGILNGTLLIAVGAFGGRLVLSASRARLAVGGLLVTAWGNIVAAWIAPLAEVRGLTFSGASINSLVYLLFIAAVVGVILAVTLVFLGARAAMRGSPAP